MVWTLELWMSLNQSRRVQNSVKLLIIEVLSKLNLHLNFLPDLFKCSCLNCGDNISAQITAPTQSTSMIHIQVESWMECFSRTLYNPRRRIHDTFCGRTFPRPARSSYSSMTCRKAANSWETFTVDMVQLLFHSLHTVSGGMESRTSQVWLPEFGYHPKSWYKITLAQWSFQRLSIITS